MDHDLIKHLEIEKFRADEEDVKAYVQSIISKTNKPEILSWIHHLSDHDLQSLITPYLTEKLTEELAEKEY
ncbi:hypothetical protein [uncultured Metabacillus sp.]|uniref:hypothetical protein n=1 Tax=uncultured Metabacillus sp. TaxID=2860135 RepID=UPI002614215D|nr:hypothetical protein [uncultured Metabacillus sp.]